MPLVHGACPWCGRGQTLMGHERECAVCLRPVRVALLPGGEAHVLRAVPATTPDPWPEGAR